MLYNDSVGYSQPGVSYSGSLVITIPGQSIPITLQDINIYFSSDVDSSNASTLSYITINYYAEGSIVSFESVPSSGEAILSVSSSGSSSGLVSISSI